MSGVGTVRLLGSFAPDLGIEPPEWALGALCAQADPECFYPPEGGDVTLPKSICRLCEFRPQCLADIMRYEAGHSATTRHGVCAGMTRHERARLARTGWQPGDPLPPIIIRNGPHRSRVLDGAA